MNQDILAADANPGSNGEALRAVLRDARRAIRYDTKDWPVRAFIENARFVESPGRRRWSREHKTLYIESVFLGLASSVPVYLQPADEGTFVIIDGLQRISALREFASNQLRMVRSDWLTVPEIAQMRWIDFDVVTRRRFLDETIRVVMVDPDVAPEIRRDIHIHLSPTIVDEPARLPKDVDSLQHMALRSRSGELYGLTCAERWRKYE